MVKAGSSLVATPISPPGPISSTFSPPPSKPTISDCRLVHSFLPFLLICTPGFISISSPTLSLPWNSDPPITPQQYLLVDFRACLCQKTGPHTCVGFLGIFGGFILSWMTSPIYNVSSLLGRYRYDWCAFGAGALDEFLYFLVTF